MGSKQLKRVTAEFLIATSGRLCSYSDPFRGFRAREVLYPGYRGKEPVETDVRRALKGLVGFVFI